MKENKELTKICRRSFYLRVLRLTGFRFRQAKTRFGIIDCPKKREARVLTSMIIIRLMNSESCLYFYDESTFSMNDLRGKFWAHESDREPLHLRNPTLRLKLNIVISNDRLIAFQISLASHKKEDVAEFVLKVMLTEANKKNMAFKPYLVLDNSPKNRNKRFLEKVRESSFGLIFITPGTPEQNMSKSFFLLAKQEFRKLNSLARINESENPTFEMIKILLQAIQIVAKTKFSQIGSMFINEIASTLNV